MRSERDDLSWQIDDHESSGNQPTDRRDRQVSGRMGEPTFIVFLSVLALLLAYLAYRRWQEYVIQQEIVTFVVAEDLAAQTGDVGAAMDFVTNQDERWRNWQENWPTQGLANPNPDPALHRDLDTEIGVRVIDLSATSAHVLVERVYRDHSGNPLTYGYDQFYDIEDGQWKRTAPPAEFWGHWNVYHGSRVSMQYYEPDRDLIEKDVGPYVDRMFVTLCALTACPDDKFPQELIFRSRYPGDSPVDPGSPLSLELWPTLSGTPLDEASRRRFRMGVAGLAFSRVAGELFVLATGEPDIERMSVFGYCLFRVERPSDVEDCQKIGFVQ